MPQDDATPEQDPSPQSDAAARNTHGTVNAEPVEEAPGKLRQNPPKRKAAGMPAVIKSMQLIFEKAGPIRGIHGLLVLNQHDGIDCMSCAWPEPDGKRRVAEFCENGAKALAHEMDKRKCGPEFFAQHSVAELSQMSDYWLEQQGRLTHPMVLRAGATHYEPIEWEEAFVLIAAELNKLASPDEASFYTSGRASNEAAFVYQLFVRQFGTNNLPDCSNMCHESSGSALVATIGIGKGTVTLEDFEKTQLIFIVGQNPGTNHPRMLTALADAKKHGAVIVAVNPLPEAGLLGFMDPQKPLGLLGMADPLADHFLQLRINGDIALFKGIMKRMIELDDRTPGSVLNWDFIRAKTEGIESLLADLRAADWNAIEHDCGLPRARIEAIGDLVAARDRIIVCWAMGITQHREAVDAIQEMVNMLLLRGSMGREGAGACPVRGHSNVQGDRTMGVWEKPPEGLLDKLQAAFHFDPPRRHGMDTVQTIQAMHAGKVKVFISLAGNFLSNAPDTHYTQAALSQLELSARIGTKLNRADLVVGRQALILPTMGRSEIDHTSQGDQFVTTENSMGVIEMSRGRFAPASPLLRSETAIICSIAAATLGSKSTVDWKAWAANYDLVRDAIAKVILGCEDYNQRVRQVGGFYLPNGARHNEYKTDTGKAKFTVNAIPKRDLKPGQLILMTLRAHDQFNSTIYALDDRYRGVHNERRVIFMNAQDMQERALEPRTIVDITGHHEGEQRLAKHFVVIQYDIPRGCCATYYPEGNVLVPITSTARESNQPTSKYVIVTVARAAAAPQRIDYDRADAGLTRSN
jgi:molybdopterin-dependent oxidoreductase alpha subunit